MFPTTARTTADAGALCLKSGNASILRGGSESHKSSAAILDCLQAGLKSAGLPETAIQAVPTTDRAAVGILLNMSETVEMRLASVSDAPQLALMSRDLIEVGLGS